MIVLNYLQTKCISLSLHSETIYGYKREHQGSAQWQWFQFCWSTEETWKRLQRNGSSDDTVFPSKYWCRLDPLTQKPSSIQSHGRCLGEADSVSTNHSVVSLKHIWMINKWWIIGNTAGRNWGNIKLQAADCWHFGRCPKWTVNYVGAISWRRSLR